MPGEDIYANISVFRHRNRHIFVHDLFYPPDNPPNQYFDLHDATLRILDQEEMKNLTEIRDEQKGEACKIYLHWKFREDHGYVRKKAKEYFPLTGSYPGVNECTTIPRKKEPEQLEIKTVNGRREEAIRQICRKQNIQQLIHFTHIDNLSNILRFGLVGRDKISELLDPAKVKINDEIRIDGYPEAVCLSISFPNYRMFYLYHQKFPADWVVLALRPEILWKFDCAFCRENAASNNVRNVPIHVRKESQSLEEMFADIGDVQRSQLKIPDWFTTNPQAEVLVFERIYPRYIQKVYFYDYQSMNNWFRANPNVDPNLLAVERDYFSARSDYRFWQNPMKKKEINGDFADEIPF
jgi:hypothetical protein